jgi:hypothetical protein
VGTAATTPLHPNVAATRGIRIGSIVARRWWLRPIAPPGLSPVVHALSHFEKALEAPCPFHGGQTKHLLKDRATIRCYIRGTLGQQGKA